MRPRRIRLQEAITPFRRGATHTSRGGFHPALHTDGPQIAALYGELADRTGSPVVELNRAVAVAEAGEVEAALALVERLQLDRYHHLHATRAELLRRLDRVEDVRVAYDRALELVHSDAERRFLERRLAEPGADWGFRALVRRHVYRT